MTFAKGDRWITLGAMAVAAVFIFGNLGDRALWDDEAQTALQARQILEYGVPKFDLAGNVPTDRADLADFNDQGTFIWNTWLPFYLTAGSFSLFGESDWAARLPFALFGFLSVALYMRISRLALSSNWHLALAASLLLACIPFFLHLRQCRYYSLVVFGTLLMVWAYVDIAQGRRNRWFLLASAALFCFYSFFAISILNLLAVWVHAVGTGRGRRTYGNLVKATLVFLGCALPAAVYLRLWDRPAQFPLTLTRFTEYLWVYLLWINGFVLAFFVPVLAAVVGRWRNSWMLVCSYVAFLLGVVASGAVAQLAFLGCSLAGVAAFSLWSWIGRLRRGGNSAPALYSVTGVFVGTYLLVLSVITPFPFYRYLTPVIPLILLMGAVLIVKIFEVNKALGGVVLALALFSNLLSAAPIGLFESVLGEDPPERSRYTVVPRESWRWEELRTDLVAFSRELTTHVADPEEGVAEYFRRVGQPGEAVKTSYGDISLMFYVPELRIISRWNSGGGVPDYVLVRDPYPLAQDAGFLQGVQGVEYAPETISVANAVWTNRADPLFHQFSTVEGLRPLVVYRRRGAGRGSE